MEDQIVTLRDHVSRTRDWADRVEAKANELEREKNRLQSRLNAIENTEKNRRREAAIEYEQRDRYRDVVEAVSGQHQDKGNHKCTCGATYPCATVQAATRADPGIASNYWS